MNYTEKFSKLLEPLKDKYNKNKRFKNHIINFDDYKSLLLKKNNGQRLTKNETKCLNRFKEVFDVNILKQFLKKT